MASRRSERNAQGPTIPQAIVEHASRGDAVALRYIASDKSATVETYESLAAETLRRAQNFLDLGLRKGDKVAFVIPDTREFILSFLGALAAGVVPVPMYPPLSFGKLDAYVETAMKIIGASESRMILTDSRFQTVLWSLVDRCESVDTLQTVDVLSRETDTVPDVDHLGPEDVAFLQFTSGSTADPKGVIVTHGSLCANMDGIMNAGLQIEETDKACSWLPLYHDMGLIGCVLAPVWYGIEATYLSTIDFVKHPSRWMEAMHEYGANLSFAPNFAYALAVRRTKESKLEQMDLSHIKALGCGAEPNHPGTLNTFLDYFGRAGLKRNVLLPAYGMAEATLAMTFVGLEDELKVDYVDPEIYQTEGRAKPLKINGSKPDHALEFVSCGRPFPEHGIVIVDADGNPLPERHVGEIVFQGPSVTAGYFREKAKTAETYREIGLMTGDLGYLADGELYVTGRKKDVIILNGRNYDPQSVEWVVQEVEGIRKGNVVAFSIPGEQTEELVIVAETKADLDLDALAREVTRAVQQELFLKPGDIVLVGRGTLPKTSSGKLQRRKTREQYLSGAIGVEGVRTIGSQGARLMLAKHIAQSAVSQVRHKVRRRAASLISRITPQSK